MPFASAPSLAAQTCDTRTYPLSTPTARFIDNHDGTVTDSQNGLMWMRCAIGQTWTGTACAGPPTALSWQSAQLAAITLNAHGGYARHTDWRMPPLPQLAMIAERQCANPRINLTLFPGTPPALFWTATGRRGESNGTQAYWLSFGPEGIGAASKDDPHFARLVRVSP
jgi:hypothetical protein